MRIQVLFEVELSDLFLSINVLVFSIIVLATNDVLEELELGLAATWLGMLEPLGEIKRLCQELSAV